MKTACLLLLGAAWFGALTLSTRTVTAAEPEPPAARTEEGDDATPRFHDGLYLRLAFGGGFVNDHLRSEALPFFPITGDASGPSGVGDLAAAYAFRPGMFLGANVFVEQVASPKIQVEGVDVASDVSVGAFIMGGPMFIWYLKPEKGFRLEATLGAARIQIKDKSGKLKDSQPIGGGGAVGVGYDFWVADSFTIGFMGRVVAASLNDSDAKLRHTWTSTSILVVGTYN